jgi:hypothetical protein
MKVCKAAAGMGRLPCKIPNNCALTECWEDDVTEIRIEGQAVIEEREATHGDYRSQAFFAQRVKEEMHGQGGWAKLTAPQKETLEMIAVKMSRILHGNPNEPDHWRDISGYATLITNLLTKGTHL